MKRRHRLIVAGLLAPLLLSACGGGSGPLLTDPLTSQLVSLQQMESPDFVVDQAAQPLSATALATASRLRTADLSHDGLVAAEQVSYLRSVTDFLDSDGPIAVIATVARFGSDDGAHAWFLTDSARLWHTAGALQISTGPLGNEAIGVSQIAAYPGGGDAVRLSIEWRTDNLVNLIEVEGRYGGTDLDDALYVALRQQRNEAG